MTCLQSTKHSDKLQTVSFPTSYLSSKIIGRIELRHSFFFYRKFTILFDFYIAQASTSMYTIFPSIRKETFVNSWRVCIHRRIRGRKFDKSIWFLPWFASIHDGYRYLTRRKFLISIKSRADFQSNQRISNGFDDISMKRSTDMWLFCFVKKREGEKKNKKERR